jgi:hypothetical protein
MLINYKGFISAEHSKPSLGFFLITVLLLLPLSKACDTGYTGVNCDECAAGYFSNLGSCTSCTVVSPYCLTCSNGVACATCQDGYVGSSCWACPRGTFWLSSPVGCVSCMANCYVCSEAASCQTCNVGYTGDTCAGCATGYTGTNCTSCQDGYFLTGRFCHSCTTISVACTACSDYVNCTMCSTGLTGSTCSTCETGY